MKNCDFVLHVFRLKILILSGNKKNNDVRKFYDKKWDARALDYVDI